MRWLPLPTAVLVAALAVLAPAGPAHAGHASGLSEEPHQLTIPQLQEAMEHGRLTAVALTEHYLERIERLDGRVHAVLALDPTAQAQAAASDERRANGELRGPLDGIPVLLKDNIDTAGLASTAGSRALVDTPPPTDAVLVDRLRAGGAVLLGKTNLSEWANFRSTNSTSGWSAVGGQTANPHVLDRNPCGSSSGSGAAVAAALAQVAIGTETDGSIVCPAAASGVVGHKPSLGLVSRTGVVPISAEQDTAGPMARTVVDAAITLAVLQGTDPRDPATSEVPAGTLPDDASTWHPDALCGKRIGVWRLAGADADTDRVVNAAVETLRARGAEVVEVELPYQQEIGAAELPALLTEFRHDLEAYLAERPGGPDTLAELIAFNRADPIELSLFGQELFEQALAAPSVEDPGYQEARATASDLARRSIDETLAAERLDAIMAPTNSPAWLTDYPTGDAFVLGSSTPAAVAGYPNVSVPAGSAGPLPIGVSFFAGRWADSEVLALAAGFEAAADTRRAPELLPTLGS